jgi:hypothetical protein
MKSEFERSQNNHPNVIGKVFEKNAKHSCKIFKNTFECYN